MTSRPTSMALEWLLIVLLFFVIAGGRVPDVNEAHYLTKAKSFWHPDWCARDAFLSSANAHWTFYWSFGWVTRIQSLPVTAWVGRVFGWALLAASWLCLSRSVVNGRTSRLPMHALLTAGLAAVSWEFTHMAGEWVIGGFEAKVPAYACLFFALASAIKHWYSVTIVLVGTAIALHPLVGGWGAIALLHAAWRGSADYPVPSMDHPNPIAIILTALLAAAGILPALFMDRADSTVVAEANQTYVYERLPHHLIVHGMDPLLISRFVGLVVAWFWLQRRGILSRENRLVQRFAVGSLGIASVGVAWEIAGVFNPALAAGFLKYYWFRLADIAIPVAVSFLVAEQLQNSRQRGSHYFQPATVLVLIVITTGVSVRFWQHRVDPRPGADRQGQMLSATQRDKAIRRYDDWRSLCDWVHHFTDEQALFLTPTYSQTFKWYAHRAELATWKDIPQDATSVVQWNRRRELIAATGVYDSSRAVDVDAWNALLEAAPFDYVITVRELGHLDWQLPIVYQNASFRVYRVGTPLGTRPQVRPVESHQK